ncbi:MLX-interacting protein-like isoform X3 [Lytechinus pictus]|uniref:MLX-interacting protein-like isoform X3 n=1 Tax=Lytechinus pictus TaxID=7653 RepID=UPI0030B9FAEF
MTKRDGCPLDKMTKMDQIENCETKLLQRTENCNENANNSDVRVHSPGKSTGTRQSSSGSFSEFSASSFRDSPRSAPSSLPGSRCGSTPGSRLASRSNSQESIIDLFDSMTLQFGQIIEGTGQGIHLFSPKPRPLRHPKWSWQERVRINHAIWRSWHMQYVKGKKPVICQFSAPAPDSRPRLQADVIQGRPINKQWNPSQLGSAVRDYHKWRVFGRDLFMGESAQRTVEDHAINLDMPHPPLSPMSAQKLMNDDTLKDFSDTLFISTERKNFTVPAPRKITRHVYNSDIIQPGLMQLEPDFDEDFMETLDSLQADILAKTPTKQDTDSLGMNYSLPPNFLSDTSLGSLSEAMEITDPTKSLLNAYPIAIIGSNGSSNNSKQVLNQRSVTFATAPPTIVSCQYDPMVSSIPLSDFTQSPLNQTYSQAAGQVSSGQVSGQAPRQVQGQSPSQSSASRRNMQLPDLSQVHIPMQGVTCSVSSRGQHSSQQSLPMASLSYQQPNTSSHLTTSLASNQVYPSSHTKLGAQSPTPTSPPACIQNVPMNQGPNATTMGVINEAIDLLSSQMTSSSSKILPDWTTQYTHPMRTTSWAPTSQSNVDITEQLKTSLSDATFLTYQQIQTDLSCTMDPMAQMDQSTVLGHSLYGGNMSSGQPHQHHQQHQVPSPGQQHQVPSPKQYSVASPQQHSVASPQYSVPSPQQHSMPSPQQHSIASPQSHQVASPQPQEELMDFEQYSALNVVGVSGLNAYRQPKRAEVTHSSQTNSRSNSKANSRANSRPSSRPSSRGNSRASSRANSPRASYAGLSGHFQDSLQAALQGKSEVKEPGLLRSPSTDRDLTISVPSSCQASAASSAASSPGSQIEYPETPTSMREFEFHAPRAKKQKTPESGSKDKEARRRIKHIHSEHKRRYHIQTGLDEIQSLIPGMNNGGSDNSSKISTATMLQKAHEYIQHLKEETNNLRKEMDRTREEIQRVNDEICECQDSLPDTGAPVNSQSERQLQQMCNEYINQQMQDNWKWWIFSMIAKPLFVSYVAAVCTNPGANFDEEVVDWVEESCRLKPLRKLVYTIVRQVSTRTSVLQNPVQLPQEVREIIKKEIENPSSEHS